MKMRHFFAIFCPLLSAMVVFSSCESDDEPAAEGSNGNSNVVTTVPETTRLEFPRTRDDGNSIVVVHSTARYGVNYAVEWDCEKRAQRWTCYAMYASNSVENWSRNAWRNEQGVYWQGTYWTYDPFQEDPDLPTYCRTTLEDYRGTGYNRGHICPSADRLCSQDANGQTFYLSNMQPQRYNFNGGIWLDMENQVRRWNSNSYRDTLYVCKGGTIEDYGTTQGVLSTTSTGMIVPRYFFMAVLCKRGTTYKALGFWAEHENTNRGGDDLGNYVVSIRRLEQLTGIDFFCNLPDDIENRVEDLAPEQIRLAWGL